MLFFSSANEWHNKRNVPVYASAECVPTRSGRRGTLRLSQGGMPVGETREEGGIEIKIKAFFYFSVLSQAKLRQPIYILFHRC